MCQSGLTVTVVLIIVIIPSGQSAIQTYAPWSPPIEPLPVSATMHATGLAGPLLLQLDDPATYSLTNGESTEEQLSSYIGYNSGYYSHSTANFHDIYSNPALLAEERVSSTTMHDDDSFHLNNMPSRYVEFHPKTLPPPTTSPPPIYPLDPNGNNDTTTTSTTTTTTEEPEESSIRVLPLRKQPQRGVLDLLFPSTRVKTFKAVFDTFRRMMSNTF